ncbi:hypothetical protein ACSBR2_035192 [Camellia fascicularis]
MGRRSEGECVEKVFFPSYFAGTSMVPGTKTGRRRKIATNPIASPSGTFAPVIVTPQTLSDETQPPDDTQIFVEGTQAHGVGKTIDMFEIGEDFHTDQQAQEIVDTKAYLLYKDWRYTLKQHYKKLVKEGIDDPYSHPPKGVFLDDWKHMIDVAWKDESHLKRSKAGKANRSLLPYNHTSGSRSFPIAMSLMDAMVNLQATATDAGILLTYEELLQQVLGQRKNYLRGFGIGLRPYLPSDSAARSRDKQMEAMRSEIDVLQENLMKEKEERQRDREEMMREREELMKEVEEGKKAREAQQEQLNHLNSMVL